MATSPNAIDHFAIQKVLADYCFALDYKLWDQFEHIFAPDVEAKYPFPSGENLHGMKAVQTAIHERLGSITTQHALSTQSIIVHVDGMTASSKTYFTATHFGQVAEEGTILTAYGTYNDELVCVAGEPRMYGATGKWLIKKREVVFFGRNGNPKVMEHA